MQQATKNPAPTGEASALAPGLGLLVFLFLTFRLFSLVMLQVGGLFGPTSDFDYYFQLGQLTDQHAWPFLTYWSEYPPLFPFLATGVYRLAEAVTHAPPPSGLDESLLRLALLPFDVGNLLLVYQLGRRLDGPVQGLRCAWVYAALFAPAFLWLGWFEPLPVFCGLLSLSLLVDGRPGAAGVAAGLGVMAKVLPGLVVLVAIRTALSRLAWRQAWRPIVRFGLGAAAAVAAIGAPLAGLNLPVFLVSVRSWVERPPWESAWAIVEGYYSFGLVPSPLARAGWPTYVPHLVAHPSVGLAPLIGLAMGLAGVFLLDWRTAGARGQVAMGGALFGVTILVASGFSPQFIAWLIPFAVLLVPDWRGVAYVTALTAVVLLGERYLYYWLFPPSAWLLSGLVLLRSILVLLLLGEFWQAVHPSISGRWIVCRRVGLVGFFAGVVVLGWLGLRAYAAGGWGEAALHDPARRLAAQIEQESDPTDALVTFRQATYNQLGPWLGNRAWYYLAPDQLATRGAREASLRALATDHSRLLLIGPAGSDASGLAAVRPWLARYAVDAGEQPLRDGYQLHQFLLPAGLGWPALSPAVDQFARVSPNLEFLGYSATVSAPLHPGDVVRLTLFWKAEGPLTAPLALTVRLVPRDGGQALAVPTPNGDSLSYPPTEWTPGQVVVENEAVRVPSNARPGSYAIAIGWSANGPSAAAPRPSGQSETHATLLRDLVLHLAER